MNGEKAVDTFIKVMFPLWLAQCSPDQGLAVLMDKWYRGEQDAPPLPPSATPEYRSIADDSRSPWAQLLVGTPAQQLYVEGYRGTEDEEESPGWDAWQANNMDSRQGALYRGALAHSLSYAMVLPGRKHPLTGKKLPVIKGYSATSMVALYGEWDDFPLMAMYGRPGPGGVWTFGLIDETDIHYITSSSYGDSSNAKWISSEAHGAPVCPVVRYSPMLDLEGRSRGEIQPVLNILKRLDRDVLDRHTAQRKASWKVRYATGMVKPVDDEEKALVERVLSQGDILVNESVDGKFGTLDSTDLAQFVGSEEADLRTLSAISRVPPAQLLGQIANLSAEALAAAEAQLMRKVAEMKHAFGDSHELVFLLCLFYMTGAAELDDSAQVRWEDMGSQSLAATADALGKLAQMLQVPVQMLWEQIPGWTQQDVERAKRLAGEGDSAALLAQVLEAQLGGTTTTTASGLTVPASAAEQAPAVPAA